MRIKLKDEDCVCTFANLRERLRTDKEAEECIGKADAERLLGERLKMYSQLKLKVLLHNYEDEIKAIEEGLKQSKPKTTNPFAGTTDGAPLFLSAQWYSFEIISKTESENKKCVLTISFTRTIGDILFYYDTFQSHKTEAEAIAAIKAHLSERFTVMVEEIESEIALLRRVIKGHEAEKF